MIILDGQYTFDTYGLTEIAPLRRNSSRQDTITGYLVATQSRFVRWRFRCNLLVGRSDLETLQEFFATQLGVFDFIDWRGFSWLTAAGSDNSSHAYSTGALFDQEELVPAPQQANGYLACDQHFIVPVTFIVSARGIRTSDGAGGGVGMLHSATPGGTINGINNTFTTAAAYGTILLFKNIGLMVLGVDYTYSGTTITILPGAIPNTGSSLTYFYVE